MEVLLLFPGQGSQSPGMAKDLAAAFPAARDVWKRTDDALGTPLSALAFAAVIAAVAVAHLVFKADAVLTFWIAYILTRPFGASCGDWLSQPAASGGLGLGTVGTSAMFLAVILALVVYLTAKKTSPTLQAIAEA